MSDEVDCKKRAEEYFTAVTTLAAILEVGLIPSPVEKELPPYETLEQYTMRPSNRIVYFYYNYDSGRDFIRADIWSPNQHQKQEVLDWDFGAQCWEPIPFNWDPWDHFVEPPVDARPVKAGRIVGI